MKLALKIVILAVLFMPVLVGAQVATGTPQYGSFGGGPFDTVNLGNLNVYFSIPIVDKAGRGMPFVYNLAYNSSVWEAPAVSGSGTWTPVQAFGWTSQTAVVTGYMSYHMTTINGRVRGSGGIWYTCPTVLYSGFVYNDPFGVQHPFFGDTQNTSSQPPQCDPPASQPNFSAIASDGSGYQLSVTNYHISVLNSPTGKLISPPSTNQYSSGVVTDTNGNQISSNGSGTFTDTLGTTALTVGGGAPSAETFSYTNPQGSQSTYSMNYQYYTVATDFQISGIAEYGPLANYLVSSIQLPDGTSYSFTYERTPAGANCTPLNGTFQNYCVTGRIASATLPTGGTVSYAYSGGPSNTGIYSDGSTANLTRTLSPGGEWTYSRSLVSGTPGPGSAWTTTINDPSSPSNTTVSNFAEDSTTSTSGPSTVPTYNLYETQRQIYQGSSTLLLTKIVCYNLNWTNCASPSTTVGSPITQTDTYTELPNAQAKLSQVVYNGSSTVPGLIGAETDFDYGVNQGAAPTPNPLRSAIILYATLNGIVGLPSTVEVEDWQNGWVSKTTYSYDQGSVTPTSGTPQHVSVTGSRGNLTTLSTYTASGTSLNQTAAYYDTGELYTSTDVNGASTTYVYGSGSCGNTFATTIDEPLGLFRSAAWNCNGSVATSVIDENNQTSVVTYNDPNFWRPTQTSDQENNPTSITYINQTAVESSLSFNSNNSIVDFRSSVDGFGRPNLNQRLQGPGATNYDTTETDYNNVGFADRSTMLFSAAAGGTNSSAPGVSTTYDALGRVLTTTDSDGGTTSYTYTDNDVLVTVSGTGSQSFQKQFEYDGLGRLTSVCEISSTLAGRGTCGQTSQQTGFWTKYTYDGAGRLLTAIQNAQAASNQQQTRSYYYDWAGRLTSEVNPETGTVSYTYDSACGSYAASLGDMTKRVDNAGNTTCYVYDALHRLTDAGYNGPVCRHYRYDNSPTPYNNGTPPSGVTVANTMTRLKEASTDQCSFTTLQTDEWFSYSPRGELTDVYESTPHSGGYYHTTAAYWPSGALETLSGIPSVPMLNYGAGGNGLDGEGRYTKVYASSGTNPVTDVTYSTSSTANPLGSLTGVTYGSSDGDSFTYDPNTGRALTYTFSVNGSTDVGTTTWNINGTLASLNINDQIPSTNDSQSCTSYTYDDLGRLAGVTCGAGTGSQSFSYDPFGNISKTANGFGLSFQPSSYNAANQPMVSGMSFDADGNTKTDNIGNTYTWDPNWGNMTSVNGITATYDALGSVVEQANGSGYNQILWSAVGKVAIMNGTSLAKAFAGLPGGGTAVYTSSGLAYYRHADWLGSSRLASTPSRTLYSSTAYAPFGEQYATSGTADPSFTGENSDTVSSLYDFTFRRLSPSQGRWISPDPAGLAAVDITSPQSWNRYAYVYNLPTAVTDPTGLQPLGGPWRYDPSTCDGIACGGGDGESGSGGGGCSLDGMALSCEVVFGLINAGDTLDCPNDDCGLPGRIFIGSNGEQYVLTQSDDPNDNDPWVWTAQNGEQVSLSDGTLEEDLPMIYSGLNEIELISLGANLPSNNPGGNVPWQPCKIGNCQQKTIKVITVPPGNMCGGALKNGIVIPDTFVSEWLCQGQGPACSQNEQSYFDSCEATPGNRGFEGNGVVCAPFGGNGCGIAAQCCHEP